MKRGTWRAALISASLAVLVPARPAGADEALALRRVLLSSGGVGYFEYEAKVQGDADLPLAVPLDQVDDVLKSIVVYDDHGSVGEITLPGEGAPRMRAFRDLPFDASALALRAGAARRPARRRGPRHHGERHARRDASSRSRTRRSQLPDKGGTTRRHRLALAASGTVTSVLLEDVHEPHLRRSDAAGAARRRARRAARPEGAGAAHADDPQRRRGRLRVVRVGYVVAVPLWKSTYRLTLSTDPAEQEGRAPGLGRRREPERRRLEGRGPHPGVGQPGHLPAGPLRVVLREAAGDPGGGDGPRAAPPR